jgi:hypothetical protein
MPALRRLPTVQVVTWTLAYASEEDARGGCQVRLRHLQQVSEPLNKTGGGCDGAALHRDHEKIFGRSLRNLESSAWEKLVQEKHAMQGGSTWIR